MISFLLSCLSHHPSCDPSSPNDRTVTPILPRRIYRLSQTAEHLQLPTVYILLDLWFLTSTLRGYTFAPGARGSGSPPTTAAPRHTPALHSPLHFLAEITMGAGALIEPLVVVSLLFGGTWVNRNTRYRIFDRRHASRSTHSRSSSPGSTESGYSSPRSSSSLLDDHRVSSPSLLTPQEPYWRKREVRLFGWRREVVSPNTRRFEGYFLSRLLRKFPFLVEAWYWALIYWVSFQYSH